MSDFNQNGITIVYHVNVQLLQCFNTSSLSLIRSRTAKQRVIIITWITGVGFKKFILSSKKCSCYSILVLGSNSQILNSIYFVPTISILKTFVNTILLSCRHDIEIHVVLCCRAGDHGKIVMEHSSKITKMADSVNNLQDLCIAFFRYQFTNLNSKCWKLRCIFVPESN